MGPASLLPASMAIAGMVVEKGEDGEVGTWSGQLSSLQTRPGPVFSDCWLEDGSLLLTEAIW